jgi:thioredoxin 1
MDQLRTVVVLFDSACGGGYDCHPPKERKSVSVSNLTEVTDSTFQAEVIGQPGPVLVDFGAVWCHPCHKLDPLVEELAAEWGARVKVVHVDADRNVDSTMRFQVMGLPTLIVFVGGQPVARLQGFHPKKRIAETVQPHLGG